MVRIVTPNGFTSPGIKLFSSICKKKLSRNEKFVSITPVSGDDSVSDTTGSISGVTGVSFTLLSIDLFEFSTGFFCGVA